MKKTAAAILSLLLMTGTVAGMADGAYTPGTYRQSAKGMGGDVVVDVTFDADAMTAIDVVSQNETTGLGDVALTSVAQAMLDAQSADVDGVAGATVASNALISAVRQAAEQAGCDVSALMKAPEKEVPETTEYTADVIIVGAGSLYQRTHSSVDHAGVGFINALSAGLDGRDAQIVYSTTAKELVMEDGKCVGVVAEDRDGNTITFHANKNVILATGGFARNKEMLAEYNTSGKWPDLTKITGTNMPGITGDGIRMAQSVGAALRDMDQIQLLQTTQPGTGNCVYAYVAPKEAAGYLFFNKEGHRFIGEDGRRDDISLAALAQTDALFYMLESSDVITDPDNQYDLLGVTMSECINAGAIIVGDTFEELCGKVGWDYETVKAQIDEYNANVDANAMKDEYGRALFTIKQENGPWYAIPRTPSVHHTMGGVVINTDTQVLDENGNAIPGLLAAGEVTGGIHGANRVGGNALVDCITYGRIAGRKAAQ